MFQVIRRVAACIAGCAALLYVVSSQAAQLAVVIDDVGYNLARSERLLRLPGTVTLAVLPNAPYAADVAAAAQRYGKEIILHQPMEAHASPWVRLERGTLTAAMSESELRQQLETSIRSLPNLAGVSNHTGSLLTAHEGSMRVVMDVVKQHDLYFLDSRTTAQTVALDTAQRHAVPATRRDVFLDHTIERQAIHRAFVKSIRLAQRRGQAIVIGHPHELSIRYLEQALKNLPEGVELVTVGQLARRAGPGSSGLQQTAAFPRKSPGLLSHQ